MSLSAFGDKAVRPDEKTIAETLAEGKPMWDFLRDHIKKEYKSVSEEWKFYTKEAGWTLVVKSGKRTLIYLIPLNGLFKVNFVLGERAVNAAQNASLPASIIKMISEATPYVEGRSFMFDVRTDADVGTAVKLIDIKAEC
jgi:hypothetical protein